MAQYKVPQDVEADDKLLGPFSFRQFVYLMIAGGCIALAVGLFQLFPLLAIIPAPIALFFLVLALPLKKDQPMETYLAAIVSYYLKPHNRVWTPGQRESTIDITAPKIVDDNRTRDITGEEATHRLSFLANIVDTEGYAIKGVGVNNSSQVNDELVVEANTTSDMFETNHFDSLEDAIARDENERHAEIVKGMREAIARSENMTYDNGVGSVSDVTTEPNFDSAAVVAPMVSSKLGHVENSTTTREPVEKVEKTPPKASIIELANNSDFSVATIAKEANRIKRKEKGEVFISLH